MWPPQSPLYNYLHDNTFWTSNRLRNVHFFLKRNLLTESNLTLMEVLLTKLPLFSALYPGFESRDSFSSYYWLPPSPYFFPSIAPFPSALASSARHVFLGSSLHIYVYNALLVFKP